MTIPALVLEASRFDPALFTFDPTGHVYKYDGQPIRSVTQILKKVGLIPPFEDFVPPYVLGPALARGTAVHRAIHYWNERDLNLQEFDATFPEWAGYLRSWIRLLDSGRLQTLACEQRVISLAPRFAGTLDWIGTFDNHAAILDYATGDPEDVCKHLQLAAYVLAARATALVSAGSGLLKTFFERHNHIRRFAVRLSRSGGLPQLTAYDDPRDFSKFLLIAESVNVVDIERPKSITWNWRADHTTTEEEQSWQSVHP